MSDNGKLISKIDSTNHLVNKSYSYIVLSWDCMTGKVDKIDDIDVEVEKIEMVVKQTNIKDSMKKLKRNIKL